MAGGTIAVCDLFTYFATKLIYVRRDEAYTVLSRIRKPDSNISEEVSIECVEKGCGGAFCTFFRLFVIPLR